MRILTETKVKQLDLVVTSDHDVFRLDIPVDDMVGVAMRDSSDHLLEVEARLLLTEAGLRLACDELKQLLPVYILLHQVYELIVVVSLVVLYYVGVVKLYQDGYLVNDALHVELHLLFVHYFDGYLEVGVMNVVGLEDLAVGA